MEVGGASLVYNYLANIFSSILLMTVEKKVYPFSISNLTIVHCAGIGKNFWGETRKCLFLTNRGIHKHEMFSVFILCMIL